MDVGDDRYATTPSAEFRNYILKVRRVFDGRGGDSDDLATDRHELEGLFDRFGGVHRIASEHRLNDHGMVAADNDTAVGWITDNYFPSTPTPIKER
jgi:hypothetical protein